MREKLYWRLASLLPLLVPLVSLLSSTLRNSFTEGGSPPASVVQVFLLGSFFYGGIFYVIFVLITQSILWTKPEKWDRRVSLISPLIFLVMFIVGLQVYWIVTSSGSWLEIPRVLLAFSAIVVAIGYIYVVIVWVVWVIMRRVGLIRETVHQD